MKCVRFALLICAAAMAPCANLTRGPYVQLGTPTSMVVRWRTDVATDSRVTCGAAPQPATVCASSAALVTEHELTLPGLNPDTRYYYAAGSTTETLAGGADFYFVTAPTAGTPKPTRIWVAGDTRSADANELAVLEAYQRLAGSRHTDLWLMLGDNAGDVGSDAQYQSGLFGMFPDLLRKSVLWATRGNHEATDASGSVYYDAVTLPTGGQAGGVASQTEKYYSFDYGNIHFIALDSTGSDLSTTGPMMIWLKSDLAATTSDWVIAFWHHAPYSDGAHKSDTDATMTAMRQNFLPVLEGRGVDLVLTGHSHDYERSFLLDGHYGTSSTFNSSYVKDGGSGKPPAYYSKPNTGPNPHQGTVYAVVGSSGLLGGGTLQYPAMYYSANLMGSLVLDIDGQKLQAKFLRETGAIDDWFTLVKGPAGAPVGPAIGGPASLSDGMAGTPYTAEFTGTGNPPPTWSASGSLPPGMTLHPTGVYTGTPTAQGTYTFTVTASNAAGSASVSRTHIIAPLARLPYGGTVWVLPGTVEAENYDTGGEGLAYHDTTAINEGGKYRTGGVDIEFGADGGAGYDVSSVKAGEWLAYTVNITAAGSYTLTARTASNGAGGTFHVEFDGANKTGTLAAPNTGGWQTWQSVTSPAFTLPAGPQTMRVAMDTNGGTGSVGNFNWFRLAPAATPPSAPTGLSAAAISASRVDLAWTDTSTNEDGFKIERSLDGTNFTQIATTAANVVTYSDAGVTGGTTYYYRVRAFNSGGNSDYSNPASVTTPAGPPAAPSNLTAAAASKSQINLAWRDNSANELGFHIERSTDGRTFQELAAVSGGVTSYADTTVAANKRYYYRVHAYNGSGDSAYSNTANAKTPRK